MILSVLADRLAIVNRDVIANIINGLMWYFAVVLRTLNGGRYGNQTHFEAVRVTDKYTYVPII